MLVSRKRLDLRKGFVPRATRVQTCNMVQSARRGGLYGRPSRGEGDRKGRPYAKIVRCA